MGQSDSKEAQLLQRVSNLENDSTHWREVVTEFQSIPLTETFVKRTSVLLKKIFIERSLGATMID